ncbi:MAG: hypothetical protein PVF46_06215 [Lysobacterales bacterium]|jgi:hypothetical protein
MTARILASLFLSLAMAACTGQGSRPVADTDAAARNAAVAPTPDTSVVTERDRESWLALTDAAAMEQAYLDMKGTKGFIDGSKW